MASISNTRRKPRRKKRQTKFILIIGCHHRDVLGPDGCGWTIDPNVKLHSDEVRVAEMNRQQRGKARVITANKGVPEDGFLTVSLPM